MQTDCTVGSLEFEGHDRRRVVAAFDGGTITSDAGALLLRHTDKAIGLFDRMAGCFEDHRKPELVVHSLRAMLGQRVAGIALGYEDIIDHDELRHDVVLGLLAESLEPRRDDCAALAGKATINRLEHAPTGAPTRYHKIGHDEAAIENLFVDLFVESRESPPRRIVLDLDATDDAIHGQQEGRFFHGYYDCYCYLPLYIFCGRQLLAAKLRRADIDASAGAKEEIERLVRRIRERWPEVEILLRADSGFAREELMAWCEANKVDYLFGLAKNKRLLGEIAELLAKVAAKTAASGRPARRFAEFFYATRKTWSRQRRVVAKAEVLPRGDNPRFVVTSLTAKAWPARRLYEKLYCARGEMENRIKECQLDLFADRTSAASMRANQLRLWFASFAYVLIEALRRIALAGTALAKATCGTIRLKLLKIGARVRVSVRRVLVSMASSCPYQNDFALAHARLSA